MWKKYFAIFGIMIFLAGCGNLKSIPTSHGQAFQIDPGKNEEIYWLDTSTLLSALYEKHDLLSEKSKPLVFFEPAKEDWNITNEEAAKKSS